MTASPKPAASLPKAGDLIANKYRVERMIGAGGMGAVYVAVHELLKERVAIKVLLPEVVSDKDAVTRFLNEARNATRIRNEHVAQVKDVDTLPNGAPYMIMDYLDGHDLGQCQKVWGPVPIAPAVDYVLQALEALAEAHAIGVVHRDLKPANLFLTKSSDGQDCIKVLDFGISKSTDLTAPLADGGGVTNTKAVLGSPGYMSPEQIKNARNVDARADIWSMGVILYKLLTNHKPFNGDTMGEVFAAIFEETPKPIRLHRPDVPPALEQIILGGCLQRNRDQRFRNVAELAAALGPFGLPHSNLSVERIRRRLAHSTGDKSSVSQVSQVSHMAGTMMGVSGVGGQVDPSSSVSHVSQVSQSYASGSQPSYASQSQGSTSTSQSHSSVSQSHPSTSHGTAAPWAQTADGVPQASSKGPLIAVAVVLGLLVLGGGAFAIKTVLDRSAASNAPPEDPKPTATQTQSAKPPPTQTSSATGAPSDSALSIDSLPTVKPTTTATTTDTAKPTSTTTSTSTSRSTAKPKDSAPSDDVLRMRR